MAENLKAIDGQVNIPGSLGPANEEAVAAERAAGKGGMLELFGATTARGKTKDSTPEGLVEDMDKAGVEKGILPLRNDTDKQWFIDARKKFPGKFVPSMSVNPVQRGIMNEIHRIKTWVNEIGVQAIKISGYGTGVACTDSRLFPMYSTAAECNIKVMINVGYPGPAGLAENQTPLSVDKICYLFPELTVIQTHTGSPWFGEVVHNLIKYPHCYLLTNAYRPKYFPPDFIQHLNTRIQDKVMWGTGALPFKTSLDDVMSLSLREHVVRKYLRENILRLFKFS